MRNNKTVSITLEPCELLMEDKPEQTNRVGLSLLLFVQSERVPPLMQEGNHREPTSKRYGVRGVIATATTAKMP